VGNEQASHFSLLFGGAKRIGLLKPHHRCVCLEMIRVVECTIVSNSSSNAPFTCL
jgi:hypothetical protein